MDVKKSSEKTFVEMNMMSSEINKLINLNGHRSIITGATGGLGVQISHTLAELGSDLILIDRPGSSYDKLKNEIKSNFPNIEIHIFDCDLEDESNRTPIFNEIKNTVDNINIIVNNAAFVGGSDLPGWNTSLEEQSLVTWRRAFEVNLTSIFHFSRDFSSMLKKSDNSSIINIASIYGFLAPDWSLYDDTGMGNPAAYSSSKGGLIQLTKWLSTNMAPEVRVNSISPGGINRNLPEKFVQRYERKTPLKRMGNDQDIKGVVAFLASDLSKYVTGQNIVVDGGWSAW